MTVAFDTLKLARRLEAAGFSTKQAPDTAEALGDALTANVATQTDIQALRAELREVELRLRADLHAEIAALRVEMIKWVVGVGVAGVLAIGGMLLALMRMLPHP
jgi:hypothetical protein